MSTLFTKKCLVPGHRLCLRLKVLREEKNMTIETLAQKSCINKKYLQALEDCRFNDIPCPHIYIGHFIKKYVQTLGEDPTPYIAQYRQEEIQTTDTDKKQSIATKSKTILYNVPHMVRIGFSMMAVLCLLVYLGFHIHNILQAPTLVISSPRDGDISNENPIIVQGKTDPETRITINEKQIANDEQGNFSEEITLKNGINTLVVSVENKHGKQSTETYHVIYKEVNKLTQK